MSSSKSGTYLGVRGAGMVGAGWGRFCRIDRGKGYVKVLCDALDVGALEDTFIGDSQRRFGNTARSQGVVDSIMLELEQLGNLLEGQEFVHLGSLGFGGHAGSDKTSLPQSLA